MGTDCNDYKPEQPAIIPEIVKTDIIEIKQDQPGQDKSPGKTIVIEKPLSLKHSLFCEYIVKQGILPQEAYLKVYTNAKRNTASTQTSLLLDKLNIKNEIQRLRNENNTTYKESIENLHNKAIKRLDKIIETSDKDSVAMAGINAIINRTVPIVNKSMHVGVKVTRQEIDRRYNALQE